MSDRIENQEFEEKISEFSLILRENIDYIHMQLEEIELDNSHNIDFSELAFLTVCGLIGFISWVDILQEFGTKTVGITIFLFLGLLLGAYTMILIKKNKLIKKIIKYMESKQVVLRNTEDVFIELQKYMHTKNLDPKQIEDISRKILRYAKNMREVYENYKEISTQDLGDVSEKKGYRRALKSFLQYEKNMFQEIINGFNIIFDFWITTHISNIEFYQDQIEAIHSGNAHQNNALLSAVTRMDLNIKMFEKIQVLNT